MNTITQALQDPVVQASGAFIERRRPGRPDPDGEQRPSTSTAPRTKSRGMPPELGQHTEEVLLEMGYDWDGIIALKESGAIP